MAAPSSGEWKIEAKHEFLDKHLRVPSSCCADDERRIRNLVDCACHHDINKPFSVPPHQTKTEIPLLHHFMKRDSLVQNGLLLLEDLDVDPLVTTASGDNVLVTLLKTFLLSNCNPDHYYALFRQVLEAITFNLQKRKEIAIRGCMTLMRERIVDHDKERRAGLPSDLVGEHVLPFLKPPESSCLQEPTRRFLENWRDRTLKGLVFGYGISLFIVSSLI